MQLFCCKSLLVKKRKEELERKRQKLAELRRSREERKNALLSAQQRKEATVRHFYNFIILFMIYI